MSNQPQPQSNRNSQLRKLMDAAFNFNELRTLCFDLGYDFDKFGGESQGKTAVIRKTIEYADKQNQLEQLIAACATATPNYDWPTGPAPDQPCPYRGLFAFREEDKHLFFGREAFTEMLTEFVLARRLTAVIGSSGSGKSSVVFAGLIPALRQQGNWLVVTFRPGERPFHALAAVLMPHLDPMLSKVDQLAETKNLANRLQAGELALADILPDILAQQAANTRLLLIADQFEELYTLCPDGDTRHRFLDLLLDNEGGHKALPYNFHTVLTLRADFMGQALAYPPLVAALQNNDIKLGPMTPNELRRAIAEPAKRATVQLEDGLIDRILDDMGTDGRNLPLLEFALTELWQQQNGHQLSHTAYERIGQVRGALARHADTIYDSLTAAEQAQAERIFVQLVHPGAGAEDTRRLATKAEIGKANWPLVQKLAGSDTRLLVADQDDSGKNSAEVIHEALIQHWQRLQSWMDTHRDFRAWQERLRNDLDFWVKNNQREGFLLSGGPLFLAKEQLKNHSPKINRLEKSYILKSIQSDRKIQKEKLAQLQRLRTVSRITPIISASINLNQISRNIIQEILTAFNKADNACLVEHLPNKNQVAIAANTHQFYRVDVPLNGEETFRTQLDKRRGIVGRVIMTGEPVNVQDISQDVDYIRANSATQSELAVPIVIDEVISYVLIVESDQKAAFTEYDQELLITLANHVGLAIKNVAQFKRAQALELTKQTATMATGLIHDINNAVATFPDLVDEIVLKYEINRDISAPLNNLRKGVKVTDKISGRLRDFIFTETYQPGLVNIRTLINNGIDLSRPQKPAHVTIQKEIAPEVPKVQADSLWIELLLKNLLVNAFSAIPHDREGKVIIAVDADETHVHVRVEDNGNGIAKELQQDVFDFGISTKSGGVNKMQGIGLFHSQLIAQVHDGLLQLESEPGVGSVFTLSLPLKISPQN
ncbi:High-affnity carbon uptake protein Hat/HatR [hydrothermal vent metagenome]|uniref:histidine kinase n=1 Tax=hydrothermal vent metagenome TaxID=652676 RepID=A0A3B0UTY9_9ZZZZ